MTRLFNNSSNINIFTMKKHDYIKHLKTGIIKPGYFTMFTMNLREEKFKQTTKTKQGENSIIELIP